MEQTQEDLYPWLSYLDGPSDEHRVAGLLLAARHLVNMKSDDALGELVTKVASKMVDSGKFLERLLRDDDEAQEAWSLSEAGRAGATIVCRLSEADGRAVTILAPFSWRSMLNSLERASDARMRGVECSLDDLRLCLECCDALLGAEDGAQPRRSEVKPTLAALVVDLDLPEATRTLAMDMLSKILAEGGASLGPREVDAVVDAAAKCASSHELQREVKLLELAATSFVRRQDVVPEVRSTEARASRHACFEAVTAAVPRLLYASGISSLAAPDTVRDAALRLAVALTRTFGVEWLAEHQGTVLKLVSRIAATEARLSLEEALSLIEDDAPATGRLSSRAIRATLCLTFLELLVQGLLGDDEDVDSDDEEPNETESSRLVSLIQPDALLDLRDALSDATDAALAFVSETHLRRKVLPDSKDKPNTAHQHTLDLQLCRECFRFLGRVAIESAEEPGRDNIHEKLAELSPFVAELMALDHGQSASAIHVASYLNEELN